MYYNKNTKNKSFIRMWRLLQDNDVENNMFMLQLHDESLKDFDLEDLTEMDEKERQKIMLKVRKECEENIWFFFREIVRVPNPMQEAISDFDSMSRYILTDDEMMMIYLYDKHKSFIVDKGTSENNHGYNTTLFLLEYYEWNIKKLQTKVYHTQDIYKRLYALSAANIDLLKSLFSLNRIDSREDLLQIIDDKNENSEFCITDLDNTFDGGFLHINDRYANTLVSAMIITVVNSSEKSLYGVTQIGMNFIPFLDGGEPFGVFTMLLFKEIQDDDFFSYFDKIPEHGTKIFYF